MKKITFLLVSTLLSISVYAADVVVTSNADNSPGTLRDAIENASTTEATTITFNGDMVITLDAYMFIQERVEDTENPGNNIDGSGREIIIDGGNNKVEINGDDATSFFKTNETSSLTLRNLTLKNAKSTDAHGAVLFAKGRLEIYDCKFIDNNAGGKWGGVMYLDRNVVVIENSEFINNMATNRGGAICGNAANLSIVNSLFEGNVVNQGGTGLGSAVYNVHGDNAAELSTRTEVVNCLFIKNKMKGANAKPRTGGTITGGLWTAIWPYKEAPVVNIYNSVFWGNHTDDGSGKPNANGYATELFTLNNGGINISNSIFENVNLVATDDIREEAGRELFYASIGAINLSSVSNCLDGMTSTSVFDGETPFVDYSNSDYSLVAMVGANTNPLIDAGVSAGYSLTMPSSDLAGNDRIAGVGIDVGAYEYGSTPTAIGDEPVSQTKSYYNKTNQNLFIQSDTNNNSVEVYNLSGVKVLQMSDVSSRLSLHELTSGLYIVRINKTETLKILK